MNNFARILQPLSILGILICVTLLLGLWTVAQIIDAFQHPNPTFSFNEPFQKLAAEGYDVPAFYLEYERGQNALTYTKVMRRDPDVIRDIKRKQNDEVNAKRLELGQKFTAGRERERATGDDWIKRGPKKSAPFAKVKKVPLAFLVSLVALVIQLAYVSQLYRPVPSGKRR